MAISAAIVGGLDWSVTSGHKQMIIISKKFPPPNDGPLNCAISQAMECAISRVGWK